MSEASRARSRVPEIALGLILAVVAVVLLVVALNRPESEQAITPTTAQVGQCVDLTGEKEQFSLMPTDCEEPHDGEIVLVTSAKDVDTEDFPDYASNAKICASLLPKGVQKKLFEDHAEQDIALILLAGDVTTLTEDDTIVCYARAQDRLTGSLLE